MHYPEDILSMAAGFQPARVLISAAELDLFTLLADEATSAETLARAQGWQLRALTVLLDALAALSLLEKRDGRYQTSASLAPFLRSDRPTTVVPMLLHRERLWRTWSDLTQIVRETGGPVGHGEVTEDPATMQAFIDAMHVVSTPRARRLIEAIDAGEATRLLDVGGASGTWTMAFLAANPVLKATLFDLPQVAALAHERLGAAGLLDRVTLAPGDFYEDELPGGHDLAFLSAIIHQNSRAQNRDLFAKIHAALVPGGRLVLRDHVMSEDRLTPKAGALFAVNMLVGTEGGGCYTLSEIRADLESAGFTEVHLRRDGERMDQLVEARVRSA